MGMADYLGLTTLAFLAPMAPEWPVRRAPPKGNGWILGLSAGFLLLVTLVPLSLALAEKWAMDDFGAACRTSGGKVSYIPADDGRPYRCNAPKP
ncbi:hypothetical protein [Methylobacterium sp. BTF04]|uniref:hypothetical protein n=1 Tax=Methylobacterium sp. BTF04 TaxID=2708300 RepID=UPI0019548521|nr:hypothetical protein [Methylobacterium sp. BTF04]